MLSFRQNVKLPGWLHQKMTTVSQVRIFQLCCVTFSTFCLVLWQGRNSSKFNLSVFGLEVDTVIVKLFIQLERLNFICQYLMKNKVISCWQTTIEVENIDAWTNISSALYQHKIVLLSTYSKDKIHIWNRKLLKSPPCFLH